MHFVEILIKHLHVLRSDWVKKFEIDSLDLLDFVLSKKEGFIIVLDSTAGNRIHHYSCTLVQKNNFIKKVLENPKKNVRFVWVDSAVEATGDLKSELCMNCISPMKHFLF